MLLRLSFRVREGRVINVLLYICLFMQLHCVFVRTEQTRVKRVSSWCPVMLSRFRLSSLFLL